MKPRKLAKRGIAVTIVAIILLINSVMGLAGVAMQLSLNAECTGSCIGWNVFFVGWGVSGLAVGLFLILRNIWAIWLACVLFALVALSIRIGPFVFEPRFGLSFFLGMDTEHSGFSLNILAVIAITLLISAYGRDRECNISNNSLEADAAKPRGSS